MTNQDITSAYNEGCSPFLLTSILNSTVGGFINQKRALNMTKRDVEFDKQIIENKENKLDERLIRDNYAAIQKQQIKKQYKRIESRAELEKEYNKIELKMFFDDWPLVLDINTLLVKLNNIKEPPLYFVIARHNTYSDNDPLSLSYNVIIDLTKKNLRMVGITDDRVLTFKPEVKRVGGPSIANCFAMMQSLSTVMILPNVGLDGNSIDFNVALWNNDSRLPYIRKVFSFDYNIIKMLGDSSYRNDIENKIAKSITAIAVVFDDCKGIIEYKKKAVLPQYLDTFSLQTEQSILEFAIREYSSLREPKSILMECVEVNGDADDSLDLDAIGFLAKEAVQTLKERI